MHKSASASLVAPVGLVVLVLLSWCNSVVPVLLVKFCWSGSTGRFCWSVGSRQWYFSKSFVGLMIVLDCDRNCVALFCSMSDNDERKLLSNETSNNIRSLKQHQFAACNWLTLFPASKHKIEFWCTTTGAMLFGLLVLLVSLSGSLGSNRQKAALLNKLLEGLCILVLKADPMVGEIWGTPHPCIGFVPLCMP